MTTLFFEPHITGHRQEYINHLIDYISENQPPGDFIFIVHPDFIRAGHSNSQQLKIEALSSPRKPGPRNATLSSGNLQPATITTITTTTTITTITTITTTTTITTNNILLRSLQTYRLADRYARQHSADHLCFLNFNDVQFALGIFRPKYSVSGILFKPFARHKRDSFRHWLTWQRKYLQTWFFVRNRRIQNLFILNDHKSADYLNRTFHTTIFQMLPDPVPKLTPEPGFDVRAHFGISAERKIFLHIGSLLKRKGTLDILDSLRFLTEAELSRFALLIIGHADHETDIGIRKRLPSTNNRQPATGNRQLTTGNRQPTTCIRYHNEFISSSVFKSCMDQCDLVLVPYRYTESSSGIAGHAIASGKPLLGVRKGLLGEMIAEHGTGIFIDESSPACIAEGLKRALSADLTGKTSLRFLQMHTKEAFAENLIASITR